MVDAERHLEAVVSEAGVGIGRQVDRLRAPGRTTTGWAATAWAGFQAGCSLGAEGVPLSLARAAGLQIHYNTPLGRIGWPRVGGVAVVRWWAGRTALHTSRSRPRCPSAAFRSFDKSLTDWSEASCSSTAA